MCWLGGTGWCTTGSWCRGASTAGAATEAPSSSGTRPGRSASPTYPPTSHGGCNVRSLALSPLLPPQVRPGEAASHRAARRALLLPPSTGLTRRPQIIKKSNSITNTKQLPHTDTNFGKVPEDKQETDCFVFNIYDKTLVITKPGGTQHCCVS